MDNQNPQSPPPPPPQQEPDFKKPKLSTTTTTTTTNSDDEDHTTTTITTDKKPRYKRRKIAILFAYCGVGYQGMQKNPGAKTIEGDLEEAFYFSGAVPEADRGCPKRFDFARSARTDKGVSAVGQVVSGKFYVDPPGFVDRLNNNLPDQFRVFGFKRVTPSFSAKKFCDRRRYVYLLPVFALDPTSHRDRESVLASLGSDNELAKCLECSERGRKVEIQSGISSNTLSAKQEVVEIQSLISSNTVAANQEVVIQSDISSNTVAANQEVVIQSEILSSTLSANQEVELQSGISSNTFNALSGSDGKEENLASLVKYCENGSGSDAVNGVVKENVFRFGDKEKERFNKILKHYEGTHNFHNFTTRTKAADPSAKRYIISFRADTTVTVEGIEFVKCEVVGQSFMLHQIRKMIGVAVAVARNCAPESLMETALQQDVRINVPTAPEVGLYLDECFFSSYNQKWKNTHEEVSMKDYAEEAEEFKLKHIYSHIASTEHKEGAVAVWLHSLNYRNYPDLGPDENGGAIETSGAQVEETTGCNRDILGYPGPYNQISDPLLDLVASGRVGFQPIHFYGKPTVLKIDLEHLSFTMKNRLNLVLPFIQELRNRYVGDSETSVTNTIIADVNMMVDTAMSVTYNRLRYILQRYDPTVFVSHMNPRSPLSNKYKFPAFISSVLGSIGPLRITDGIQDTLVVYATSANRSQTYGRDQPFDFKCGQLSRLIDSLAAIGVPLAPIDVKVGNREGTFFSTIIPTHKNGLWDFTATFHHSHYIHQDIVSAWLTLNDDPALCAFEDCSVRIECCTNPDVVNAIIALRPDGVPDDVDGATAPTRAVGGIFEVNVFGVRPVVAAKGGKSAVPAAVYMLGRGTERYYCNSLARDIREHEMLSLLRYDLFKTSSRSTNF